MTDKDDPHNEAPTPDEAKAAPAAQAPDSDSQTVFNPDPTSSRPAKPKTKPRTRAGTASGRAKPATPAGRKGQIKVGDVLNHIFEVRRFIARGGMGEVFEGVNVNTDERVAIKVILPHLAADPAVQAMFRKEARTLTRINHAGLVQYRVLAQEPRLGVFYIVTDYIDGANLSDRLATLEATPAQLRGLLRKLAEGLAAAHSLGAIHRDISPDNVILADNRLERAKIIDFGIAKDLDASAATIVGEGFAGKLNYVSPEQLGDFGREIGPWSDVYSLGLTIMAVALGRNVEMGGTLVDAVDKRRAGLDVSDAPPELQHVLREMLRPDPAERLRSMEDVLRLLDSAPRSAPGGFAPRQALAAVGDRLRDNGTDPKQVALFGGGALLLALALALVLWPRGGDEAASVQNAAQAPRAAASVPAAGEAVAARAVEAEMRTLACSWLDLASVTSNGGRVSLAFRGVSGKIAEARSRIQGALKGAGIKRASIDFSDVSPISANTCGPIEAFVLVRAERQARLAVTQRKFGMGPLPASAGPEAGQLGAEAVFKLNLAGFDNDLSLVGIDESGEMVQLADSQAKVVRNSTDLGDRHYRFSFFTTHSGWSGILLLTGSGPFDPDLLTSKAGVRGKNWEERFLRLARERNWKSEMVWYRTVGK